MGFAVDFATRARLASGQLYAVYRADSSSKALRISAAMSWSVCLAPLTCASTLLMVASIMWRMRGLGKCLASSRMRYNVAS